MATKEHVPFSDVVAELAQNDSWGSQQDGKDAAVEALLGDPAKLAAMATVELSRVLHKFISAMGYVRSNRQQTIVKPANAKAFPGKKIGDRIYCGDLDDGVKEYLIIAADSDGFCRMVPLYCGMDQMVLQDCFACEYHHESAVAALADAARKEIEYVEPRLIRARAALAAAESGVDVAEFLDGYNFDDQ